MGSTESIFNSPQHPYTQALLSSIPSIDPENKSTAIELKGEIPSAMDPPSGCVFRTRCPNPTHKCKYGDTSNFLEEKELKDILVVLGGIIPDADLPGLREIGIEGVFQPGTPMQAIIDFIHTNIRQGQPDS